MRQWLSRAAFDLRRRRRALRRTTLIGPLAEAWWIRATLREIAGDITDLHVAGPEEFSPYLRHLTPLSPLLAAPLRLGFDYVILRQDHVASLDRGLLRRLRAGFRCVAANTRFALFVPYQADRSASSPAIASLERRLDVLCAVAPTVAAPMAPPVQDRALLVTTHNRSAGLRRTLPQLAALGYPLLVVDDGSGLPALSTTRGLCNAYDAELIALPAPRGLSAAMNIGLSYLLADDRYRWISYFQDDVDVAPAIMERLRLVEDAAARPVLTGHDASEHLPTGRAVINGVAVTYKVSARATHLHAHAGYWREVMPIPTHYLRAPRRRWEASLADYWVVNHAPRSIGKRGMPVTCLPKLVRTFLHDAADSTWNNPNPEDSPLNAALRRPAEPFDVDS